LFVFAAKFLRLSPRGSRRDGGAKLAWPNEQGKRGGWPRRGGPGGPGGPPSMARLAMIDKVQDALKITDEQKTKIEKINADFRKEMSGDRPDPEKNEEDADEVTGQVEGSAQRRSTEAANGIFVSGYGAGAVMDPAVGKEIDLTDEQKDKLHEAMAPPPEGRKGEAAAVNRFRIARPRWIRSHGCADARATEEARVAQGEKVDIDMSALRGPGGGREAVVAIAESR